MAVFSVFQAPPPVGVPGGLERATGNCRPIPPGGMPGVDGLLGTPPVMEVGNDIGRGNPPLPGMVGIRLGGGTKALAGKSIGKLKGVLRTTILENCKTFCISMVSISHAHLALHMRILGLTMMPAGNGLFAVVKVYSKHCGHETSCELPGMFFS